MIKHQITRFSTKKNKTISTNQILPYAVFIIIIALSTIQLGCSKPTTENNKSTDSKEPQVTAQPTPEPTTPQNDAQIAINSEATTTTSADLPNETENTQTKISEDDLKSITNFLENWKIAWQKSASSSGNLEKYFSFYSDDFQSGTLDFSQWKKSKTIKNQGKSWIEVWLTNIDITTTADNKLQVIFNQEYSSSNYSDKGKKMLILSADKSGFKIISEETIQ